MPSLKTTRKEDRSRLNHPRMEYYRHLYRDSPFYDGQNLNGKRMVVYGEQGLGDVIMFARYIPDLTDKGCHVTFQCQKSLHRLFENAGIAHAYIDRECQSLPDHDFHVPIMSLPFFGFKEKESPYLTATKTDVNYDGFKIGIAWEGNPEHTDNYLRCCRLELFKYIHDLPDTRLYMLHDEIHDHALLKNAEDLNLYSTDRKDFQDTADLISEMDMVITVDTSILHAAGALNRPNVFGLLSNPCDPRWDVKTWYPKVTLLRDDKGDWQTPFRALNHIAKKKGKVQIKWGAKEIPETNGILITGGIGDYVAIESHMSEDFKKKVKTVYLATRANSPIRQLIPLSFENVNVVEIPAKYEIPFYNKAEVSSHFKSIACPLPSDWSRVEDWSILVKFPQIKDKVHDFVGTKILDATTPKSRRKPYLVVCPFTDTEKEDIGRNFSESDWEEVKHFLYKHGLRCVVIAGKKVGCPKSIKFDNLSGQTTLSQSIDILNGSVGYIGIDSFLSILAGQKFPENNFAVKTVNDHLEHNADIYYPLRETLDFLSPKITTEFLERMFGKS